MESEIVHHASGGTTFAGHDATRFYQAVHLKVFIKLYAETGIRPTRHVGPTQMLALAASITGHKYKRGAFVEAEKDLGDWIETMRAALPITDERAPNIATKD